MDGEGMDDVSVRFATKTGGELVPRRSCRGGKKGKWLIRETQDEEELEDDDLSGLDSDEDSPTSNLQHVEDLKALALKDPECGFSSSRF